MARRRASIIFGWENRRKEITWKTLVSWENNIKMDLKEIARNRRLV